MCSFGTARCTLALPCLSPRTQSDRHFPDFPGACARGGGGLMAAHKQGSDMAWNAWNTSAFAPMAFPLDHCWR